MALFELIMSRLTYSTFSQTLLSLAASHIPGTGESSRLLRTVISTAPCQPSPHHLEDLPSTPPQPTSSSPLSSSFSHSGLSSLGSDATSAERPVHRLFPLWKRPRSSLPSRVLHLRTRHFGSQARIHPRQQVFHCRSPLRKMWSTSMSPAGEATRR